eukprot:c29384_g1_i2 orf=661-5040(+)
MASSIRLEGTTSRNFWAVDDGVFSRSSTVREYDDEEALKWAALEKLPTYDRVRTSILKNVLSGKRSIFSEVDVTKLAPEDRQHLIDRNLKDTEADNERFLFKIKDRINKVAIDVPKIEVRFEHLKVEADVYVGTRALPSFMNFLLNQVEDILGSLHLLPSKKRNLKILKDVSGIIKPSRMTLLLGPPASGKTTLLLALAAKLDRELKVSGRVTYNGHAMNEFVPQRTATYISQHDLHLGELTVRETLDFSGRCQGVGTRFEMLTELSRREKQAGIKPDPDIDIFMKAFAVEGQETSIVTDYVLKILGLDICADTIVGDEMRRGISGGQRKRVTTGEILVGPAGALFMDEISTGLDSSTTFQIIKCFGQSVHLLDATMIISLLQPAPETFELFDDIILLSEGEIVYQGPREFVLDFFEHMGFKCPERKGIADFLQEVTSKKDQEQYWRDRTQPYRFVTASEFASAFHSFHVGQAVDDELAVPFDRSKSHPAALSTSEYGLRKWELFKACFAREWLLMKRNSFVYVFKIVQICIMAIITMTLFLRTKMHHDTVDDGSIYTGALFFSLVNIMFNGFAELSMTIFRLPVFYKQRDLLFYPAWAFSLPSWVLKIPLSFIEAGIWVCMTYYVIGFAPEAGRFFRQFLLLIAVHQMALGLFRFIAGVARSMVIANTFGSFALLIIFVLGGFIIARQDIRGWWIWGYWISPLMYGQNAIGVNEFLAPRWHKPSSGNPSTTLGKAVLNSRGIFPDWYWFWLGLGVLVGYIFLFNFLFTVALAYLNSIGKAQTIVPEDADEKDILKKIEGNPYALQPSAVQSSSKRAASSSDVPMRDLSISAADGADSSQIAPKKGMVLPFQPLALAFDSVDYYVDMPVEMKEQGVAESRLQLLRGVSGAFRPGVLTALVGVSGAGKTTLMDVLAGRKTGGYIEGSISVSGYPKKQETFARISGYCEQNDIHSPFVTVYESLVYSAWLRLPDEVNESTRKMFVDEVMELVELTPLRNGLVGLPGVNGLSTEQRKRLTIAVELVANPSIIFMDEPTSGLDARAAAIVMRTVRNTVDTGRTVVCTIHQPSIDIFEAFDELLLMKRGGQVIYAGPLGRQSIKLVEYFEAIEDVPKIKEGYNPATWMLEVSSVSAEMRLGVDFADLYKRSSLYERNKALIKELSTPAPGGKDLYFESQYAQSFISQCIACFWKQRLSYWRNPLYTAVRFYFTAVCALIFGTVFWRMGKKRGTQEEILNVMGAMYASVLFIGINNASTVQPVVSVERTVFYREKAAGMFSALPYAFGQIAIEFPYIFFQTVVYGLLVYSMVSFQWTAVKFFWFIFFMYMTFLYFTLYGMMTVALTPNLHVGAIVSSAFYGLWNLFSGFLIPRPRIPIWWKWYYWATPVAWTLYGLIASQLGDLTDETTKVSDSTKPEIISVWIKSYYGFRHDFLGAVAGVHVAFVILFAFIFAFGIKFLNFQNR